MLVNSSTRRRSLVAVVLSLATLAVAAPSLDAAAWPDYPLTGPTELNANQQTAYESSQKCDPTDSFAASITPTGDVTSQPAVATPPFRMASGAVTFKVNPGNFVGRGQIAIVLECRPADPARRGKRFKLKVAVNGTAIAPAPAPAPGAQGGGIAPAGAGIQSGTLTPANTRVKEGQPVTMRGDLLCAPDGMITNQSVTVLEGDGTFTTAPRWNVGLVNGNVIVKFESVGVPNFASMDGDATTATAIVAVECVHDNGKKIYEGRFNVLKINAPANPRNQPIAPNNPTRGGVIVSPAILVKNGEISVKNAATAKCSNGWKVLTIAAQGLTPSDRGKFEERIVVGSETGDAITPQDGNWEIRITIKDGFLGDRPERRFGITLACMSGPGNARQTEFLYRPAVFVVRAEAPVNANPNAGANAGGAQPAQPAATAAPAVSSAPGVAPAAPSTDAPATASTDAPVAPAGSIAAGAAPGVTPAAPQAGGSSGGAAPQVGSDTNGGVVEAQQLPRAYLDGNTQQLIEISTGDVIGIYDMESGQFVDPVTGAVTGVVDSATGELIDEATGIVIGVEIDSATATGEAIDLSNLGGEESSGSNTILIVLIAVVAVLLLTIIGLLVKRRQTSTVPPPPSA